VNTPTSLHQTALRALTAARGHYLRAASSDLVADSEPTRSSRPGQPSGRPRACHSTVRRSPLATLSLLAAEPEPYTPQ
jgi:hypothetical protein